MKAMSDDIIYHIDDFGALFHDISLSSSGIACQPLSAERLTHFDAVADLIAEDFDTPIEYTTGAAHAAEACGKDDANTSCIKIGHNSFVDEQSVKFIIGSCRQSVKNAIMTSPFQGASRASRIVKAYLCSSRRSLERPVWCPDTHNGWFNKYLDSAKYLLLQVVSWMARMPYDLYTGKIKPICVGALSRCRESLRGASAESLIDFLQKRPGTTTKIPIPDSSFYPDRSYSMLLSKPVSTSQSNLEYSPTLSTQSGDRYGELQSDYEDVVSERSESPMRAAADGVTAHESIDKTDTGESRDPRFRQTNATRQTATIDPNAPLEKFMLSGDIGRDLFTFTMTDASSATPVTELESFHTTQRPGANVLTQADTVFTGQEEGNNVSRTETGPHVEGQKKQQGDCNSSFKSDEASKLVSTISSDSAPSARLSKTWFSAYVPSEIPFLVFDFSKQSQKTSTQVEPTDQLKNDDLVSETLTATKSQSSLAVPAGDVLTGPKDTTPISQSAHDSIEQLFEVTNASPLPPSNEHIGSSCRDELPAENDRTAFSFNQDFATPLMRTHDSDDPVPGREFAIPRSPGQFAKKKGYTPTREVIGNSPALKAGKTKKLQKDERGIPRDLLAVRKAIKVPWKGKHIPIRFPPEAAVLRA